MKQILITSYINPDLDGVSCAVAYGEFLEKIGKNIEVGIFGKINDETKYVLDRFNIEYPKNIASAKNYDEIILVDTCNLNELSGDIFPEKVIEIIDHHKVNEAEKFPNAKAQIELVGAAATLVGERFIQNKVEISKNSAILLMGAIISSTFNFEGGVTTERDREVFKWLSQSVKFPENFWKDLFLSKSDLSGEKLAEVMINDLAEFELGGKKVGIAQIEIIDIRKLVKQREGEIISELKKIHDEQSMDIVFLNTVDLGERFSIVVALNKDDKRMLEKVLSLKFSGNVAESSSIIKRKQIVSLLRDELEK